MDGFLKILIFLIVLALIIIYFTSSPEYNQNKCTKAPWQREKNDYRLGDIILLDNWHHRLVDIDINCILKYHPDSIAAMYFRKTNKSRDIDTLVNVLKENNKIKPSNKITMHIRMGDVLCNNVLWKFVGNKHPAKLDKIKEHLSTYDSIVDVYSFLHWGTKVEDYDSCLKKSHNYINELKNMKNVRLNLNGDIDSDFIDMISSRLHISGTGGYSNLINAVRNKLNLPIIYIE